MFLAVLTLPAAVSRPWLREITRNGDPEDIEDAWVALAFNGDAAGRAVFARLATVPSAAPVRRLLDTVRAHEALGGERSSGARAVLRSYRAIEVLDREPYFKATFINTHGVEWVPHPDGSPELRMELLPLWIARYPGHPGSDDMALRLGRRYAAKRRAADAARWYARAAALPDQDVTASAMRSLVATCELALEPADLDQLAHEQGAHTPNRSIVQYIRLRRIAAEQSLGRAVALAEALGRDEPDTSLGRAWNDRLAATPPKGLDSGSEPLAPDDPLRYVATALEEAEEQPHVMFGWSRHERTAKKRLDPPAETLRLRHTHLTRQFRTWETLVELERRAARARDGARADLLYKQAAILYHERRALFPAYAAQSTSFRRIMRHHGPAQFEHRFEDRSYGMLLAIERFHRIVRDHTDWVGLDRVYFSLGLAWKRLLTYRPYLHPHAFRPEEKSRQRVVIRNAADALETCAEQFPDSRLAASARRAAAYWRRTRPDAFD